MPVLEAMRLRISASHGKTLPPPLSPNAVRVAQLSYRQGRVAQEQTQEELPESRL